MFFKYVRQNVYVNSNFHLQYIYNFICIAYRKTILQTIVFKNIRHLCEWINSWERRNWTASSLRKIQTVNKTEDMYTKAQILFRFFMGHILQCSFWNGKTKKHHNYFWFIYRQNFKQYRSVLFLYIILYGKKIIDLLGMLLQC